MRDLGSPERGFGAGLGESLQGRLRLLVLLGVGGRGLRRKLLEHEALSLLHEYSIPVAEYSFVQDAGGVVEAAGRLGYPVALKVVSPDIVHKSDVGGVALNIKSEEELVEALERMISSINEKAPGARLEGFLVQKMAPPGAVEVAIGGLRDPVFGPAVMFGFGGVLVELFRDVSFRVSPFDRDEALEMMRETRVYRLLRGYRSIPARDLDAIVDVIMSVQRLLNERENVVELDLNPVMSYTTGVLIVDARVIVEE